MKSIFGLFLVLAILIIIPAVDYVFAAGDEPGGYLDRRVVIWNLFYKLMTVAFTVGAEAWNAERLVEHVPADAEVIKVIGQQWFWTFEHEDGTKEIGELHVKVGKAYKFEITSVLMDAVPGRVNTVWFAPMEVGEYDIQCKEYCGLIHYNMRGKLIVEDSSS